MQQCCKNYFHDYFCIMEKARIVARSIDNLGIFISILCAIHCALTPFLLLSTTFLSFNPELLESVETPFLLVSATLVFFSISTSLKHHRKFLPLIFALSGLAFILLGGIFHDQEVILRVKGSLLIVASHAINKRLTKVKNHES